MKKLLILAGVIAITCTNQVFAQEVCPEEKQPPCAIEIPTTHPQNFKKMHKPRCDFKKLETELNLTEKQKEKVKLLREKQREAAKPIFEELKVKDQEIQALRQQLRDLRLQNKKEFESILTDKQLKKLNELKAERKQEFAKHHRGDFHKRPPMPPQCRCDKKPPIEE
ncbi:hypothetical protein HDR58_04625 [bacterium]|nr:hypothetical protein [bacterium]